MDVKSTPATTDSLVSTCSVIQEEIHDLAEKNAQEHCDFSGKIKTLNNKLDLLLDAQKKEKRKEEVKKFINSSSLGFEVFAGVIDSCSLPERFTRLWIKISNKDQTDFDYVVLGDIPEIRNYFHLKIFRREPYNPPFFYPRGKVIIQVSTSAQADGNGFVPTNTYRFKFDIDMCKVSPIGGFSEIGEYFALLEIISGHSLGRIRKKIDKYALTPSDKNLLLGEKLYAYDKSKDRYLTWNEREEL